MVATRRSSSLDPNPKLQEETLDSSKGNRGWLAEKGDADGIILLGGTSLADFRIRYAQSSLRHDLTPSSWSRCGILLAGGRFASVPLDVPSVSAIPSCNGVRDCSLDDFDDPARFPNIAVIRFAETHDNALRDIERVKADRSLIDLPTLILPWLGYVWGTVGAANPLSNGIGVPGAAFVETVFAMAGFELTPGIASAASCPEAIWQSAKWWTDYYEGAAKERKEAISRSAAAAGGRKAGKTSAPAGGSDQLRAAVPMTPTGFFVVRQRAAAVLA